MPLPVPEGSWSDAELKDYLDAIHLKKGFTVSHDPIVLPFSVLELWENFFADDALYSFDDVGVALGVAINSRSEWDKPT